MSVPHDRLAAWQKEVLDATLACAQATLTTAEHLLKLNLDAARGVFEQNSASARDALAAQDPEQLSRACTRLAQLSMQQAAAYAQNVYELVADTQEQLSWLGREQFSRIDEMLAAAEQQGGSARDEEDATAAARSSLARSAEIMKELNRAADEFAQLSESSIREATTSMVRGTEKKRKSRRQPTPGALQP